MPHYTVETTYRLSVYRQRTYGAALPLMMRLLVVLAFPVMSLFLRMWGSEQRSAAPEPLPVGETGVQTEGGFAGNRLHGAQSAEEAGRKYLEVR